MLMIAGSNSGARPTARARAKRRESMSLCPASFWLRPLADARRAAKS
jgi:hypothetical protein